LENKKNPIMAAIMGQKINISIVIDMVLLSNIIKGSCFVSSPSTSLQTSSMAQGRLAERQGLLVSRPKRKHSLRYTDNRMKATSICKRAEFRTERNLNKESDSM
jgi:hypothetical protein